MIFFNQYYFNIASFFVVLCVWVYISLLTFQKVRKKLPSILKVTLSLISLPVKRNNLALYHSRINVDFDNFLVLLDSHALALGALILTDTADPGTLGAVSFDVFVLSVYLGQLTDHTAS